MGLIVRADGVDWSGLGFPLVGGFVAADKLIAAFDFGNRSDRLTEVSGKGIVAVPYRNKADGSASIQDPTVIKNTANNLGIVVENGWLDMAVANPTIGQGASSAFTMMVIGGDSGLPFAPPVTPPGAATICVLADMGNGVSSGVVPPVIQHYRVDTTVGARLNSPTTNSSNIGAPLQFSKKSCFFVSYDGSVWTYRNMTTGQVTVKTNAEIGLVGSAVPRPSCMTLRSGNYLEAANGVIGYYPELYQVVKWSKALTVDEMNGQYKAAKTKYAEVGI